MQIHWACGLLKKWFKPPKRGRGKEIPPQEVSIAANFLISKWARGHFKSTATAVRKVSGVEKIPFI